MEREPFAWRELGAIALAFVAVLIVAGGGYGYHRDELYFIAIGGHPAFGYADQPPLVPLLAHGMDAISGGSLRGLRVPPALAGGLIVLVTGLIARELGGGKGAQVLAAASMAVSAILVAAAHLLSTTAFDLLAWTVVTWLLVRAIRDDGPAWLAVGLVAGIGLEIKSLMLFLMASVVLSLLIVGPREMFRSRWIWLGGALALAIWLPNLIWQATNGWPQLTLSREIASGGSGTSLPRWQFLPYQVLLVSPVLAPIWIAGLVRLARDQALRSWRAVALAWVLLAAIFIATGGKPYYLGGMFPVLLAAGAEPAPAWSKRWALGIALALSLAVSALLFLPIVPAAQLKDTPIVDINYDAGEQVGWPALVDTVTDAYDALPEQERRHAIVLTSNYGEAGALMHAEDPLPVYSGHNSLWNLGPPPDDTTTVVAIGYSRDRLQTLFADCEQVATIDNGVDLDNDEQGEPVWVCRQPEASWQELWPDIRHYD